MNGFWGELGAASLRCGTRVFDMSQEVIGKECELS